MNGNGVTTGAEEILDVVFPSGDDAAKRCQQRVE
jgi:hypothetical protein